MAQRIFPLVGYNHHAYERMLAKMGLAEDGCHSDEMAQEAEKMLKAAAKIIPASRRFLYKLQVKACIAELQATVQVRDEQLQSLMAALEGA